MIRRWIGVLILFLFVVLGIRWAWIAPNSMEGECSYPTKALWVSVDWTSQSIQSDLVERQAEQDQANQIQYLYPYVSYLKADGTWSQSYDHARDFIQVYKAQNLDTQLLAWIGIPLQNPSQFGVQGWVELPNKATRQQIAAFASQMIDLGFDGVHLNAESVRNDDNAFVALLEEVRIAIGEEAMLSIAGAHWAIDAMGWLPIVGTFGWQSDYYREVATRVDQIATMTYDSHMPTGAIYRVWVREQVSGILAALESVPVELLFGVSVSRENTTSRNPQVENLANGLAGICAGIQSESFPLFKDGIAIYAAWEMTESDWNELR